MRQKKSKFPFGIQLGPSRVLPGASVLYHALDNQGFGRLHNKKVFLGYASRWYMDHGREVFLVHVWNASNTVNIKRRFATKERANKALIRWGIRVCQGSYVPPIRKRTRPPSVRSIVKDALESAKAAMVNLRDLQHWDKMDGDHIDEAVEAIGKLTVAINRY